VQGVPDDGHGSAYDRIFAALAHPTRRQILITLYFEGGQMGAGDIAGLVTTERHGRTRTYRLAAERIELAVSWLSWFSQQAQSDIKPREDNHD
jgi:DNA-binding transcriptional ArsR family regulator